jgi:hypothetical protein
MKMCLAPGIPIVEYPEEAGTYIYLTERVLLAINIHHFSQTLCLLGNIK